MSEKKKGKKTLIRITLIVLIIIIILLLLRSCKKKDGGTSQGNNEQSSSEVVQNNETNKEDEGKTEDEPDEPVVVEPEPVVEDEDVKHEYWVNFLNIDGTSLQRKATKEGILPVYEGKTPTYYDGVYDYVFLGWDKDIVKVSGTQIYTAQYSKTKIPHVCKHYTIQKDGSWICDTCGKLLEGTQYAYFTVLSNDQPTDIIDLRPNTVAGTNGISKEGYEIKYINSLSKQDVVIRTNSARMNITVNAPSDTVRHYGLAGNVNLQSVSNTSCIANSTIGYVELTVGRIILTNYSNVKTINIAKKDDNTYNNPIIADGGVLEENMPEIISRDQVTVNDSRGKTELVQIQTLDANGNPVTSKSEQVYAYSNGAVGTTEKVMTGENKQNEDIDSKLGIIVLDSNSNAGEKAYNSDTKSTKKQEIVNNLISATKYGGGSGTPDDPYIISSIEHLYDMSEDYKWSSLVGEYCNFNCYRLEADLTVENWTIATIHYIDLGGSATMPQCVAFGGQFDGNNHTIKFIWDSNVTEVDGNDGVSLFGEFIDSLGVEGYDRPGVMKNLTIDCNINAICDISPMFAYIWGEDCTVSNCHIKGTIKSDSYMCGISLYANVPCLVKNCSFDADVFVNVEENTARSNAYYYLSTFICQTVRNAVVFDNCVVNGSITLPYCSNIDHILYGTFYANNPSIPAESIGINSIDNCIVNIASQYNNDGTKIDRYILVDGCWYSNGPWNSGDGCNDSGIFVLKTLFDNGYISDGEGIKLTNNLTLDKDIQCNMSSGSFYLSLGNYSIIGGKKIILNKGVSVICDKSGLDIFSGVIIETDNGNGTYTYTCN